MKSNLKYLYILFAICILVLGCKDRKKDTRVFTTDDINPFMRGNVFHMGPKGYSIKVSRLQWLVVKNKHKKVDLTLYNRIFPASVEVFAERNFRENLPLEKFLRKKLKRLFPKNYDLLEQNQILIAGENGFEMKAKGQIKLKEYKTSVPRIVKISVVQKNKITYLFTFICKPEEFVNSTSDFALVLNNFKFEKITKPEFDEVIMDKLEQGKEFLR